MPVIVAVPLMVAVAPISWKPAIEVVPPRLTVPLALSKPAEAVLLTASVVPGLVNTSDPMADRDARDSVPPVMFSMTGPASLTR